MPEGIIINPDKTMQERSFDTLEDYQRVVAAPSQNGKGYIEGVYLSDGTTMYVNEEYLYIGFGPEDLNSIAMDVCGLGGRPDLMFQGILGSVVVVGPANSEGETTDVTDQARRWIQRVAREAGGVMS